MQWTEDISVNLDVIDQQHKTLFDIATELVTAIEQDKGEETLQHTFDRLKAYTHYHFKEEEAYMKEINYPHYKEHAAQHAVLLVRVNMLWQMLRNGKKISPEGAATFIHEWISSHIMHDDAKIGRFAREEL